MSIVNSIKYIFAHVFKEIAIKKKTKSTNLLRSHLRCVTQDCDRPFSTPSNNDQQMLRNFDVFSPPLMADCRNCSK